MYNLPELNRFYRWWRILCGWLDLLCLFAVISTTHISDSNSYLNCVHFLAPRLLNGRTFTIGSCSAPEIILTKVPHCTQNRIYFLASLLHEGCIIIWLRLPDSPMTWYISFLVYQLNKLCVPFSGVFTWSDTTWSLPCIGAQFARYFLHLNYVISCWALYKTFLSPFPSSPLTLYTRSRSDLIIVMYRGTYFQVPFWSGISHSSWPSLPGPLVTWYFTCKVAQYSRSHSNQIPFMYI